MKTKSKRTEQQSLRHKSGATLVYRDIPQQFSLQGDNFRWIQEGDWEDSQRLLFGRSRIQAKEQLFLGPALVRRPGINVRPVRWLLRIGDDEYCAWAELQLQFGKTTNGHLFFSQIEHRSPWLGQGQSAAERLITALFIGVKADVLFVATTREQSVFAPGLDLMFGEDIATCRQVWTLQFPGPLYAAPRGATAVLPMWTLSRASWLEHPMMKPHLVAMNYLVRRMDAEERDQAAATQPKPQGFLSRLFRPRV